MRDKHRPIWLSIAASILVAAIAIIGIAFWNHHSRGSDDSESAGRASIKESIDVTFSVLRSGNVTRYNSVQCASKKLRELEPARILRNISLDRVEGISIEGQTATAQAVHHLDESPMSVQTSIVNLIVEDGIWKVC